MSESQWEFVKNRTAADGAVWRSADGKFFKRTGGADLREEARFQRRIGELGYPVPHVVDEGTEDGRAYFVEESLGAASLHDTALAATGGQPAVMTDEVVDGAAAIAARLLTAQAAHPQPAPPGALRGWVERAGFTANVFAENPDLDTPRVRALTGRALDRLGSVPLVWSHFDYGLPNAFPAGVIDWQHHGLAPLGYDVVPALEIIAFKGGSKGYTAGAAQRARYLAALDAVSLPAAGHPVSEHLGEFLLVKSLFFLALMKPADPTRTDKLLKWDYRRRLFTMGLDQYEHCATVDTAAFPTLDEFAAGDRVTGHP
ncbi:phosphotransferase [Embleya sp. NPDC005575]|uniref:phosphotransferase family protein n=1 Tax=Embleya sp. NPDC005575 TaxID=3156892 RepID=UPI0033B9C498